MATIIAGRFEQHSQVQQTADALLRAGFSEEEISSFYVNPAGQHDRFPVGGDRNKSPGAEDSGSGTATGLAGGAAVGAAVGAVTSPLTGPGGPIVGALVGAHLGALAGTLGKMKDDGTAIDENPVPTRQSGMLVAVRVAEPAREGRAIDVLRAQGAADIERAQGEIIGGDWNDFDPLAPPELVDDAANDRPH